MSKITSRARNKLPKSEFAEPDERKYPVDTHNRAVNAKARASEMEHKGKLSPAAHAKIVKKADKVLNNKGRK